MARNTPNQTPDQAPEGEKAKRGRAAQKTFAPIAGSFAMEDVPDTEQVTFVLDTGRNEDQRLMDNFVIEAHKAWIDAGKPEFTRSTLSQANCPVPRKRIVVDPAAVEAIQTYLKRAASLYGLAVIPAPVKRHTDGRAMIYFAVKDRPERKRTAAQADAENAAENADQENPEG